MTNVLAPMPGKVMKVNAAVGNEITESFEVVVMESMKMEIPIPAGETGKVTAVIVKEGDTVDAGDVMLVIE